MANIPDDVVIIGSNSIDKYFAPTMFRFERSSSVKLSAIGSNKNKMERIVSILKTLGVKETSRKFEMKNDLEVTIVTLERMPNGQ